MSVRCNSCGEYIGRGKKFNSRKEVVVGEDYCGIQIHRFYQRCPGCSKEFAFKTDPKNSDYLTDLNCSRGYEPWKAKEKAIEEAKKQREEEEQGDTIKILENKTNDSKVEMDIIDALDSIRALNARNAKVDSEKLLEEIKQKEKQLSLAEEAELQTIFFKNAGGVKRIIDQIKDEDEDYLLPKKPKLETRNEREPKIEKKNEDIQPVRTNINILPTAKKHQQQQQQQAATSSQKPSLMKPKILVTATAKQPTSSSTTPTTSSTNQTVSSLVDY